MNTSSSDATDSVIDHLASAVLDGVEIQPPTSGLPGDDPAAAYRADVRTVVSRHLTRLPSRYRAAVVEDLNPGQRPDLVRAWTDHPDGRVLLFGGPVGSGKTFAAAAAANRCAVRELRRDLWGAPVRWFAVARLLDGLRPSAPRPPEQLWRQITSVPVLVLDDLAHVQTTPWAVEQLWRLVNDRTELDLRTIVTTNALWPDLVATWGAATMDRLREGLVAVTITGGSRRQPLDLRGLAGQEVAR